MSWCLDLESREDLVSLVAANEGESFVAGRSDEDVAEQFVCEWFTPLHWQPLFRESIRELLRGERANRPQSDVFVFRASRYWPTTWPIEDDVRRMSYVAVNTGSADDWCSQAWKKRLSFFFFDDRESFFAAYSAAWRIALGDPAAARYVNGAKWIFAADCHLKLLDAEHRARSAS